MAQKSKTGLIIGIVGGVAIIGLALFLRARKKSSSMMNDRMDRQEDFEIMPLGVPAQTGTQNGIISQKNQEKPSYAILTEIESGKLREYLASILDSYQAEKLQGWINMIRQQRAEDSTRWKINEGFTSLNASDAAHGLYQMNEQGSFNWTQSVRDNIISTQ